MNKFEQRPNTASLFKNEEKKPPREMKSSTGDTWMLEDADYKGSGKVGDIEYWVDATIKTSKSGKKYLALKFNPKQARVPPKNTMPAGTLTEDNWAKADLDDPLGF